MSVYIKRNWLRRCKTRTLAKRALSSQPYPKFMTKNASKNPYRYRIKECKERFYICEVYLSFSRSLGHLDCKSFRSEGGPVERACTFLPRFQYWKGTKSGPNSETFANIIVLAFKKLSFSSVMFWYFDFQDVYKIATSHCPFEIKSSRRKKLWKSSELSVLSGNSYADASGTNSIANDSIVEWLRKTLIETIYHV